jgi:hypothetical protein
VATIVVLLDPLAITVAPATLSGELAAMTLLEFIQPRLAGVDRCRPRAEIDNQHVPMIQKHIPEAFITDCKRFASRDRFQLFVERDAHR